MGRDVGGHRRGHHAGEVLPPPQALADPRGGEVHRRHGASAKQGPVVAVEANGVKDMIENKKNGFLCSQNIYEFSKTILRLIKNPDLRKKVSENAIKTVQNYSAEKSTKKLIRFYEKTQMRKKRKKKIIDISKFMLKFNNCDYFFNRR